MAVSTTSPPRYKQKRGRGRFYSFLFLFGLIFAGGFYVGVRATRHVERLGPDWLKPRFGVQPGWMGIPPAAPVAAPVPAAVSPAAPVNPNPVAPAAPTTGAVPATPAPNAPNTLPASRPVPPANAASPGTAAALDQNVNEYNSTLRRAENSFRDYMVASQILLAPNAAAEEHDAAADHAHTAADDLQAYVRRAQALYDTIHADPLYAKKYKETDPALDSVAVKAQFQELTTENLRYIRPKQ